MDLRFTTLGEIALTVDGIVVPVAGRRERSILALLLAARGRVVPVDRLIADVWGDAAADSARGSLQVAISRLRSLIEPDRVARAPARILISRSPGYALLTQPGSVDNDEFTDLVARAHDAMNDDSAEIAVDLCDKAIEKWTGPPFGSAATFGLIRAEAARLDDLLVSALTVRAEAMLRLGRHDLMTGELEALVAAHPWNERLRELQVLALYRAGRQRDALAELRQVREVFVGELGIDPSPTLQQLEVDILAQDPALDAPLSTPLNAFPVAADAQPEAAGSGRSGQQTGPANSAATPPFVGRDAELTDLVKVLDAALAGDSTGVIISGGAGIGKTRLVAELIDIAKAKDVKILVGASQGADVSPPYWPWIHIVREIGSSWPDFASSELLTPQSVSGDASSITLHTYEAVTNLVTEAAHHCPLLIVLEDIQWSDASSLRLLAYALPLLKSSRVLLVATVRDTTHQSDQLLACLAELGRQSTRRIDLTGLTVDQIGELITSWTGVHDTELAAEVALRTDGIPFYVMEIVRLLRTEDRLTATGASEIAVPHGVQDVLHARLALLPDAVGRLLRIAAVVGREFDLALLCTVAGISVEEALDLLGQAVLAQAIEEDAKPGRFRFTHALVRETLAESLLATRRLFLHAAIGLALEPRLAQNNDLIEDVAHHFVLGATVRPDVAGRAVEHSMAAARVAERRGVLDHALEHWQQAFAAEELAQPRILERRYEVLLGLGRARHRRGEVLKSGEALYEAIEIGRELGDTTRMATAATSFRGAGVWSWREAGASDQHVITVLEKCVAELEPGPLRARSLASLGMELTFAWRSTEADRCGILAVQMVRTIDDDDLLADVLQMRAQSLWGRPGAAAERLSLAGEILATDVSPEQELNTTFPAAAACMQLGQTTRADEMVHRCVELSLQLRHSGADVPIAHWLLHRAIAVGDRARFHELAGAAMAVHRKSELPSLSELLVIGQIRCAPTGTMPDDDQVLVAINHGNVHFRAFMGHVLAESGRIEAALDILGEPAPDNSWDYASTWGDCLRVDVLANAGPSPELLRVLDRISPWGAEFAIGGSCDFIGSIEYFIGRGREGLGDIEGARVAYQRAVQRNAEARVLPWEIRAAQRLATLPSLLGTIVDG